MQLAIDLLETFVIVAQTRNFTATGNRIHRTQSAVSMQMKRLAETVGRPLFDIQGKQIRLSPTGEILLEHAQKIIHAHKIAAREISRSQLKGRVRFGAPEDYASLFIPKILTSFAKDYPDIRVDVFCYSSDQLFYLLLQDKLDLAVCTQLEKDGEIIYQDPVVWIAAPGFEIKQNHSIPLAVYNHNCIYRKWATDALDTAGISYHIAYMSPSISGILAAVDSGLAVAPVGMSVLRTNLRLAHAGNELPGLPKACIRLHRSKNMNNPLVDHLANHVRKSFQSQSYFLSKDKVNVPGSKQLAD
ncbi:MAG: LysR family transcriptional regulator [Desulfobacteraceae bacterium]|nr:LysR family transcriptional regulator [Desulfobacteraceae bacterium]